MVDIETLGTKPNSIITSIAAAQFNIVTGAIGRKIEIKVDTADCLKHGLEIELNTFFWWLKQSDIARENLSSYQNIGYPLKEALKNLSIFFNDVKRYIDPPVFVWARGPRFDLAILTSAYTKLEMAVPWDFRNEMCVRTMEFLRPDVKAGVPKVDDVGHGSEGGGEHNAMNDVKYQINYVVEIFKNLNNLYEL